MIRCGSTAGILVPMRMNSRCGIARRLAEDPVELVFAKRQRIAAADQHVADLRRLPDVLERLLQPRFAGHDLAVPDHARPRAVAAVGRAEIEGQQQHAVGIAMHQARRRAVPVFAERIVGLARRAQELARRRE